jgi:hypothetical protein
MIDPSIPKSLICPEHLSIKHLDANNIIIVSTIVINIIIITVNIGCSSPSSS